MSTSTDQTRSQLRRGLGIDIGAASVKACCIEDGTIVWSESRPHDGDLPGTLRRILTEHSVKPGIPT